MLISFLRLCLVVAAVLYSTEFMQAQVRVSFIIKSTQIVPSGQTVYVTGGHPYLGDYNPGIMSLYESSPGTFIRSFSLPWGVLLSYRVTRGNWESEAVDKNGNIMDQLFLEVKRDTVIELLVPAWKDQYGNPAFKRRPSSKTRTVVKASEPKADEIVIKNSTAKAIPAVAFEEEPPEPPEIREIINWEKVQGLGLSARDVKVWLPKGYTRKKNAKKKYPVLYVHEAQDVFKKGRKGTKNWHLDEVVDSLSELDKMKQVIVVAINNQFDPSFPASDRGVVKHYLRFVKDNVKPMIDSEYRTLKGPKNNACIGTKMGGLLAFMLAYEFPDQFGSAACFSPVFEFQDEYFTYAKRVRDSKFKKNIKLYFDCGNEFSERKLLDGINRMKGVLQDKGYALQTADNVSSSWENRIILPLLYLYPK